MSQIDSVTNILSDSSHEDQEDSSSNESNTSEEETSNDGNDDSQEKGYVDTEGNKKCAKEGKAQASFLADRDKKKQSAVSAYQSYSSKITEYVTDHSNDCSAGIGESSSRWDTCPNDRNDASSEDEE